MGTEDDNDKANDKTKDEERRYLPDRRRGDDRRGGLRWDPRQKERRTGDDRRRKNKTAGFVY